MDKEQTLASITKLSSESNITKKEVVEAFEKGVSKNVHKALSSFNISQVLYFIGGFIIFIGVSIMIWQNWTTLSNFTKIIATLGIGVAAYYVGILLNKEEKYGAVSFAFHLIGALVIPIGLYVFLDIAGSNFGTPGASSLIFGVLLAMYLSSYFVFKKTIFMFFSIVFSSIFFFTFTNFLIGTNPFFTDSKFYEYRFYVLGLSYLCLGYYFSSNIHKNLTGVLYSFGNLFFLGASLALGGWKPSQDVFWELIFIGQVFAILLFSVHLKSRSFLTFGTIFLMLYIFKITSEYFTDTLGWPITLMFCGIALIATGYYAFNVNKKYISPSS